MPPRHPSSTQAFASCGESTPWHTTSMTLRSMCHHSKSTESTFPMTTITLLHAAPLGANLTLLQASQATLEDHSAIAPAVHLHAWSPPSFLAAVSKLVRTGYEHDWQSPTCFSDTECAATFKLPGFMVCGSAVSTRKEDPFRLARRQQAAAKRPAKRRISAPKAKIPMSIETVETVKSVKTTTEVTTALKTTTRRASTASFASSCCGYGT